MTTTTHEKHEFMGRAGNSFRCAFHGCTDPPGAAIHQDVVPKWSPGPQPWEPDASTVATNGTNGNVVADRPEPPVTQPSSAKKAKPDHSPASPKKSSRSRAGMFKYISLHFDPAIYAELEAAAKTEGVSPSTHCFTVIAESLGYTFKPATWEKKH